VFLELGAVRGERHLKCVELFAGTGDNFFKTYFYKALALMVLTVLLIGLSL
jgi:hypothetical protein